MTISSPDGQLGGELVSLFQSPDLAELITATVETDPAFARRLVDQDRAAAAIIIPAGFSQSVIPTSASGGLDLYANPTRPTSVGVWRFRYE